MPLESAEHLLTSDEVMERLLAEPHLRRLASTCVLTAVRCGAEWRFRQSELNAWIARQPGPSAPIHYDKPFS